MGKMGEEKTKKKKKKVFNFNREFVFVFNSEIFETSAKMKAECVSSRIPSEIEERRSDRTTYRYKLHTSVLWSAVYERPRKTV